MLASDIKWENPFGEGEAGRILMKGLLAKITIY